MCLSTTHSYLSKAFKKPILGTTFAAFGWDTDKYSMHTLDSTVIDLTPYIIQHLQDGAGSSWKNALRIDEGTEDYVDVEYGVLRALAEVLHYRYVVVRQLYMLRKGRCLDKISIKRDDRRIVHFWFDVTFAVSNY
jgi:hypothetical protein